MSTASASPQTNTARRRPKRDDVRRELLAAAAHVFARRGTSGASVADIAAEAGYTKGAVYSNFGSKKDLIDAVVRHRTSSQFEFGLKAAASTPGNISAKGQALGDGLDASRDDEQDWLLLFIELWQRAVRDEKMSDAFRRRRSESIDEITSAVREQLEKSGSTVSFTAREIAVVISALTTGMAMEYAVAPDDVPSGLLGRVLAELVTSRA